VPFVAPEYLFRAILIPFLILSLAALGLNASSQELLGGQGPALAEVLAERVQARLVLTARTALPSRTQWTAWLAEHGEDDPTSRKILAIRALEAKGSQVLTFAANVADVQQMRAVIDGALAAFGEVNGVIHAAGVMGGGIIPLKTRSMADEVLAPKVLGTAVLDHVLAGLPIDFMLLCSSFNSIVGTAGQVDYSAANAYLDAFAHAKALDGGPWTVSVNWATWQEVGMAYNAPVTEQMRQVKQRLLNDGMRTKEAQSAFERVLTNPLPQWIVSPQSFNGLLATILPEREPIGPETGDGTESSYSGQQEEAGGKLHARPALQTAYVAPRNAVETQIAEVWQELFGIDRIGVDDNFFELGGHSLMATQVLVRLQECFGIDLPARIIFETHTIAELASQLEIILWVAQNPRSQEDTAEDREELEF